MHADVPHIVVEDKKLNENLFNSNASCPPDNTLRLDFAGKVFTYTFSYTKICGGLEIIGYFILVMCYLYAANIVTRA